MTMLLARLDEPITLRESDSCALTDGMSGLGAVLNGLVAGHGGSSAAGNGSSVFVARFPAAAAAARLLPAGEAARALVAGFLGLELLASLDNDRTAALALLDRAGSLARLLDVLDGLRLPRGGKDRR